MVKITLRYEKLPFICYLCLYGMIGHMEENCLQFKGKNDDDCAKPYGRWLQDDMSGGDYRKPIGRKFGLDSSHGWSMKALLLGDEVEDQDIF